MLMPSWLSDSIAVGQSEISTGWERVRVAVVDLLQESVRWPQLFYDHLRATTAEALDHFVYACLVYLVICLGIYKLIFFVGSRTGKASPWCGGWRWLRFLSSLRMPSDKTLGRVLFVTAHPDDECMFFGPLIYTLTHRDVHSEVYVLCLSNGNYEKQCQLRRHELWRSCNVLGVPASNIILVNATHLPDDPNVEWKTETVANLIRNTCETLDIQALITFDREGVSQHPNHCAVYFAAASLRLANLLPKDCKLYTLDSINVFRKYISIFDILCTYCMSTHWCILKWKEAALIRKAMLEHKSQMKWFRWLYVYFSRYMFINSLRQVNLSDVELEMQIFDN